MAPADAGWKHIYPADLHVDGMTTDLLLVVSALASSDEVGSDNDQDEESRDDPTLGLAKGCADLHRRRGKVVAFIAKVGADKPAELVESGLASDLTLP